MNGDSALRILKDEAEIRDLVVRFADAANFNDLHEFRRLWTHDAVWTIAEPVAARREGPDEIVELLRTLRTTRDFFVHFAMPGPIRIDGDKASLRCVCQEAARGPGPVFYRNHAFYFDKLVRTEDGWRFSRRDYVYVWLDTSPFEGEAIPLPSHNLI